MISGTNRLRPGRYDPQNPLSVFHDRAILQLSQDVTNQTPATLASRWGYENFELFQPISAMGYPVDFQNGGITFKSTTLNRASTQPPTNPIAGAGSIPIHSNSPLYWYHVYDPHQQTDANLVFGCSGGPSLVSLDGNTFVTGVHTVWAVDRSGIWGNANIDVSTFGVADVLALIQKTYSELSLPKEGPADSRTEPTPAQDGVLAQGQFTVKGDVYSFEITYDTEGELKLSSLSWLSAQEGTEDPFWIRFKLTRPEWQYCTWTLDDLTRRASVLDKPKHLLWGANVCFRIRYVPVDEFDGEEGNNYIEFDIHRDYRNSNRYSIQGIRFFGDGFDGQVLPRDISVEAVKHIK